MIRAIARAPTSSGASAIRPCGASVTLNTATTIATAAGHSRRVPIAFSTSTQAASTPNAISGSGRRPLLNGSQAARNTAPAVQTATRLIASRRPSRGSTQRLRSSQVAMAASGGGQPHPHACGADRRQVGEHRLVPVEGRLGGAEVAVVVGGVAGVAGHPRDGQVVAVVRRDRADDVPEQQGADDADVGQPGRQPDAPEPPPGARAPATCRSGAVQHRQRHDRGERAETPSTITPSLSGVGEVMKRVSTSTRADSPGWAATFRSVNTPAT